MTNSHHKNPQTRSSCDHLKHKLNEANNRNAQQQQLIDQLRFSEERYKKTNNGINDTLKFERERYYETQLFIKQLQNENAQLEAEQQRLINQIELMTIADHHFKALHASTWLVGGIIAGALIGRYWELLWTL